MKLPTEAVREFQEAWRASGLGEISYEQAEQEAEKILFLHTTLSKHV
jgi:hypothetical protein